MKKMKLLFLAVLLFFVVSNSFAQNAIVKSVTGKVEYSTNGRTWNDLKENMTLAKGSLISTSFKSTAVIAINDSLVHVKPLSRMSLDELSKTQDEVQTDLYLVSGKVQVEVKPRTQNEVITFNVKSAVATASVRGTGFIFDGTSLLVNHGQVSLQARNGFERSVYGGEFSKVSTNGKVSAPIYLAKETSSVFADSPAEDEDTESDESSEGSAIEASEGMSVSSSAEASFGVLVSDLEREGLFKAEAAKPAPTRTNRGKEKPAEIKEVPKATVIIDIN